MTTYRLATTPADYRKCHALAKQEDDEATLSWPTVMAEQDGELVGFFGTQKHPGFVIAGPMLVRSDKRNGVIAIRLAEAYERVLWLAGVRSYRVFTQDMDFAPVLDRLGYQRIAEEDGAVWFTKTLTADAA